MKLRNNHVKSAILQGIRYSIFTSFVIGGAGCFRYSLTDKAAADLKHIEKVKNAGISPQFCASVSKVSNHSAETLNFTGECLERGLIPSPSSDLRAKFNYMKAAECGSTKAKESLKRLGEQRTDTKFAEGGTDIPLFRSTEYRQCGLEREITPAGYALAPIGIPAYGVAVVAVTGGLAAAVVGAIFIAPIMGIGTLGFGGS